MANIFQQFAAIPKLFGARKQADTAQAQADALRAKLAQLKPKTAGPAVAPGASNAPVPNVGTSATPAAGTPPPAATNPQLEALARGLGNVKSGLESLQTQTSGEDELRKAEAAVLAAQTPSTEEQSTESQLSNLLASKELGLEAIQNKPIALDFITGQKAALERRAANLTTPLTARLTQLQGKRQASIDLAKAQSEIAKARFERNKPSEEKVDEYTNTEGKRVIVYRDKNTGKTREEVLGGVQKTPTESEKTRALKTEVIKQAGQILNSSKTADGYVNANKYFELRQKYAETIGDSTGFDDLFSPMLSPKDKARLASPSSKTTSGLDFNSL